jgi:hypothetical protein
MAKLIRACSTDVVAVLAGDQANRCLCRQPPPALSPLAGSGFFRWQAQRRRGRADSAWRMFSVRLREERSGAALCGLANTAVVAAPQGHCVCGAVVLALTARLGAACARREREPTRTYAVSDRVTPATNGAKPSSGRLKVAGILHHHGSLQPDHPKDAFHRVTHKICAQTGG